MQQQQISMHHHDAKVDQFATAIEKYNINPYYKRLELVFASLIVLMQFVSMVHLVQSYRYQGWFLLLITLVITYLATDFFNGLIHMIVDNTTYYDSLAGPFIAAFHLHHVRAKYPKKSAAAIYFNESKQKFWLFSYLILLLGLQHCVNLNSHLNLGLVAFGVLSSVAEVSHYWCHHAPPNNTFIYYLQKWRILLSMRHHSLHHKQDNINYAFLNGFSDPLLNIIARCFFSGYKHNSDIHVSSYMNNNLTLN